MAALDPAAALAEARKHVDNLLREWSPISAERIRRDALAWLDAAQEKNDDQSLCAVLREMLSVATGEYDGFGQNDDQWTADNRADIDRWQAVIHDALFSRGLI